MKAAREKVEETGGQRCQRLNRFARRLLEEWKRLGLPASGERVVVAVSGGADSVALLLALEELLQTNRLALSLRVAHLNHGLRAEAGHDARWVAELSEKLGFEISVGHADVHARARTTGDNLEQAARAARYEFLTEVATKCDARLVLTAHTLDDQAETVLLRLLRGSGALGLGGIRPVRQLTQELRLARPLLSHALRAETEAYTRARGVVPRTDAMNDDERFARVRVRKHLLPLLSSFNTRAVEALARTARLLSEDDEALDSLAAELLRAASEKGAGPEVAQPESAPDEENLAPLRVFVLLNAPEALRRRALRLWIARWRPGGLRRLEMTHLLAVEALLEGERGGRMAELPGGARVSRKRGLLYLHIKRVEKGDGAD